MTSDVNSSFLVPTTPNAETESPSVEKESPSAETESPNAEKESPSAETESPSEETKSSSPIQSSKKLPSYRYLESDTSSSNSRKRDISQEQKTSSTDISTETIPR